MKIFVDFHHQALYYSLHLLFEKRLGWEVYRPIGEEWFEEDFWHVYNHPITAKQYLGLHQAKKPVNFIGSTPHNAYHRYSQFNMKYTKNDETYFVQDSICDVEHKAIRLEKFKDMKFDILLSSIPAHIPRYNNLINLYQKKAKHIFQVGNNWKNFSGVNNILASTKPFKTNKNIIFYHQEFDLDIFKYTPPKNREIINSYTHFMQKPELFKELLKILDWSGKSYGGGMDDALKTVDVAKEISKSGYTWQFKPGGDGFGHVMYNNFACGRPMLLWRPHYFGCLAEELLVENENYIDTSKLSILELAKKLKSISVEKHNNMCQKAFNSFKNAVDFKEEEIKIRRFIENIL